MWPLTLSFDKNWTTSDAILGLFCSDKIREEADENWWRKIIARELQANYSELIGAEGGRAENKPGKRAIAKIRDSRWIRKYIALAKRPDGGAAIEISLPPALWIGWAIKHVNDPICSWCLNAFSEWRTITSSRALVILQYKASDGDKIWTGPERKLTGLKKVNGFFLDEAILGSDLIPLPQRLGDMTVKWRMDTKQWYKIRTISRPLQIDGTNAASAVKKAVKEAIRSNSIKGLHEEKIEGRHVCEMKRLDLAMRLKTDYKKLLARFEPSTIERELSHFVHCRRGRPGPKVIKLRRRFS